MEWHTRVAALAANPIARRLVLLALGALLGLLGDAGLLGGEAVDALRRVLSDL